MIRFLKNTSPYVKMFSLIGEGETFKEISDSRYCMKICTVARMKDMSPMGTYNAVCLNNGKLVYMSPDCEVVLVNMVCDVKEVDNDESKSD